MRQSYPVASSKAAIKACLADDKTFLKQLTALGKKHDATGEVEDVAGGLKELMEETLEKATSEGADSDFYEAGGDSLTAFQIVARLRDALGLEVPVALVFAFPSPSDLAAAVASLADGSQTPLT